MAAIMVFTTAPDLKTASSLAKSLVEKKIAACVSVKNGIVSFYRWQGKVERTNEVSLMIKTSDKHFSKLKNFIHAAHPYEIPEILAVPVSKTSAPYLSWLEKSVR